MLFDNCMTAVRAHARPRLNTLYTILHVCGEGTNEICILEGHPETINPLSPHGTQRKQGMLLAKSRTKPMVHLGKELFYPEMCIYNSGDNKSLSPGPMKA